MAVDNSIKPYYDRFNPDLLRLIPPDLKIVLEVGCGCGALAQAYQRVNPSILWFGIDNDEFALDVAASRGVQTWKADANSAVDSAFMSDSLERDIDCVIFGDVLEHLENPWQALQSFTENIAPGAQVLASIPHIGHWSIVRDLLAGQWKYAEEGLLDKTHLRFFTLSSIKAMFADAGLHVFEVRGRQLFNEGFDAWVKFSGLRNPPKSLEIYQYLIRALKPGPFPPIIVKPPTDEEVERFKLDIVRHQGHGQILTGPIEFKPELMVPRLNLYAVVCQHMVGMRPRIIEPFQALATIPGIRTTITESSGDKLKLDPDVDTILVLQRITEEPELYLSTIQEILAAYPRCVIVYEIDDSPEDAPAMVDADFLFLKACHAVQVSTERMAETCRKWNPNVAVFENQLAELPAWEEKERPEATKDDVFIFFGALNRGNDWKPIMPALNRVIADHPELWFAVVHDREFYDALKTDRKHFKPVLDYPEYIAALRWCDIALLPLEPGRFNEHKSDIKFLECAANGVAVLASDTIYNRTISLLSPTPTGLTYLGEPSFELHLKHLIENPKSRQQLAINAYDYVESERLLGQHFRRRYDWYRSLISCRENLHWGLMERVPDLSLKGAESC